MAIDPEKKEILISLIIRWLKHKRISATSSQKIISHFGEIFGEDEDKKEIQPLFESIYKYDFQIETTIIEDEMTKLLIDVKGEESALGIVRTLKSLVPQKGLSEIQHKIPLQLKNTLYGILSFDGPTLVVCDY